MLQSLEIQGFKSFARKTTLSFDARIVGIVGPNGSGKSNVAEAFRFVLGEQSMKTMRGAKGEDMIWSGSTLVPKANRGSVSIVFDNRARIFSMDTDTVTIERTVFRDGKNEYRINTATSRLKDIHELLASVHIGSSRHHIISQGQADRILNASPTERAEMLEDALGLTSVELKKSESEEKLEKTVEHEREVSLLRKEAAPRLLYLKKQIEKKERADELKKEITELFTSYVSRESQYITETKTKLLADVKEPRTRLSSLESELDRVRSTFSKNAPHVDTTQQERRELERKILILDQTIRTLYATRAGLEFKKEHAQQPSEASVYVQQRDIDALDQKAAEEERKARIDGAYARHLHTVVTDVAVFGERVRDKKKAPEPYDEHRLRAELERVSAEITQAEEERKRLQDSVASLHQHVPVEVQKIEQERDILRISAQISELKAFIREHDLRAEQVQQKQMHLDVLIDEYRDLVVPSKKTQTSDVPYSESDQETIRTKLYRMKIRQEEYGTIDAEIIHEYEQAAARDAFLERELHDLAEARDKLRALIASLSEELQTRFSDGIRRINTEFTAYFKILFDGGEAKLVETKETKRSRGESEEIDAKHRRGVEVSVHLPRKRVSSLAILSGGERALTSIALIFAMSQIHPPPFIILDETDAALDEANSGRYAEIIKALAQKSQLIVITHNRATMAAAGTLFGITMGGDGVSKLLSVRLEEAVRVAK